MEVQMLDRSLESSPQPMASVLDLMKAEPPYPSDTEASRHMYKKRGKSIMLVAKLSDGDEERFFCWENSFGTEWKDRCPPTFLPILYNHDEVSESRCEPIFFVESEYEADRLISLGLVATSYGSSGSPPLYQEDLLIGRQILVIGQAGSEGEQFVRAVRQAYGDLASIRTLIVEKPLGGTPDGYRFADWLNDTAAIDQKMWLLTRARGECGSLEVASGRLGSAPDGNAESACPNVHEKQKAAHQPSARSAEAIPLGGAANGEIGNVATGNRHSPGHRRNRVVLSNDMTAGAEPEWLVDGVLPKEGTGMLYAPSSAGKTFIGIDLCYAVQNGQLWAGKGVKQGKAVYVAAEDSSGVCYRARVQFDAGEYGDPFSVVRADDEGLSLISEGQDLNRLIEDIDFARGDDDVRLIIIETFEKIAEGIDENMSGPVGQVWSNLARIARRFGCFVLLAHHTGKGGETYRGSSTFKNRAETILSIEERGDGNRRLQVVKQRNGISGLSAEFTLEAIPGTQTCRVMFTADWTGAPGAERERKKSKEGKGQQLQSAILGVLQERYSGTREKQIDKTDLRQHSAILSCLSPDKNEAARKAFERALCGMEQRGLIRRAGQTVELVPHGEFEPDNSKAGPDMSEYIFQQIG